MSKQNKVVAILCADIHLSLTPPVWRSNEPDWFEAMKRPLLELSQLQQEHDCPIFCAGDIFDKWNSPPELINFALDCLPNMFAIAGQHDLPLHNLKDMDKSAFCTLVKAKKIWILDSYLKLSFPGLSVTGSHYGNEEIPIHGIGGVRVHLLHKYVWKKGSSYLNAPEENRIDKVGKEIEKHNINIFVFGDNHKSFSTHVGDILIWNCGGLMRRHSDEIDYKPRLGLLYSDGHIEPYYLDVSRDMYLDSVSGEEEDIDLNLQEFFEGLTKLGKSTLDFKVAVEQYLLSVSKIINPETKKIILKAMDNVRPKKIS
jgi:predicted phosphodiesterase